MLTSKSKHNQVVSVHQPNQTMTKPQFYSGPKQLVQALLERPGWTIDVFVPPHLDPKEDFLKMVSM